VDPPPDPPPELELFDELLSELEELDRWNDGAKATVGKS
jgi:hypothetical protein